MIPATGETYRWAGKTWRVTSVDEASRTATVENVARPENTARMPFTQFVAPTVDHDPVEERGQSRPFPTNATKPVTQKR